MPTAQRPSSAQGMSQFLVQHSRCDAGFDVQHPRGVGGGAVSVRCLGCGATYEHEIADSLDLAPVPAGVVEVEREIEFAPVPAAPPATPLEPKRPAAEPEAPRKAKREKRAKKDKRRKSAPPGRRKQAPARSQRERIMVAALLIFAVLAIAFAVFRVVDANKDEAEPASPTPSASATAGGGATSTSSEPASGAGAGAEAAKPATPALSRRQVEGASLVVPASWSQTGYGGGTLIGPPGESPVSVQVFAQPTQSRDLATMSEQAIAFAESQLGKARVGTGKTRTISGNPAYEVTLRGDGAKRELLVTLADSKRFIVLGSVAAKASGAQRAAVGQALRSFRPGAG